jgi:isopenicillin N synthase-like dioxygenase
MANSIPILDLSDVNHPKLLKELRSALLNVGFLYIKNHGVSPRVVDDLVNTLPKLFALPVEEKEKVALINSPHFLGYSRFGSETTASVRDQREQFEFATELLDESNAETPLYTRLHGPNQWPLVPPKIRPIVERYIAELTLLSERFLLLVAEALDLPTRTFLPFLSEQHRLKLVHYRPAADGSSQGVGPHKDSSGWMTFLLQASDVSIKGLQALSKAGEWIDVPAIPGSFVVNMGQAFEVVTNGVCKATTHRVLLPLGDYDRYSVPFFQGVRLDLTKHELKTLWANFDEAEWQTKESEEGQLIDSAFLRGKYDTWGESQLRTKIRSHRDVGLKYYPEVFDKYVNDDT